MSAFRTLLGVLVALSLCASTSAQPAPQTGRIPTVTRLVKIFSELETAIRARARSSDPAALESSLDSSFEMRDASTPGTPVPRDEWIRQTRSTAAQSRSIDQMAVHDLGGSPARAFHRRLLEARRRRLEARRTLRERVRRMVDGQGPVWEEVREALLMGARRDTSRPTRPP
jgi:hypothetical protein